jgi:hypothetical protein
MELKMMQAIKSNSKNLSSKNESLISRLQIRLKPLIISLASLSMAIAYNVVVAGERESLEQVRSTTISLVNLLVQEGVLSKAKADELLKQASQDVAKAKEKDSLDNSQNDQSKSEQKTINEKMVRVQYVPDIVKKELREDIKKEVMSNLNYKAGERLGVPDWIDRMHWEGDLRIRYQHDGYANNNPTAYSFNSVNGTNVTNMTDDQDRLRIRARLGLKANVNDWLTAGVGLTTGSNTDPISPNQTMGASPNSAKYNFGLDRAYLKLQLNLGLVLWAGVLLIHGCLQT